MLAHDNNDAACKICIHQGKVNVGRHYFERHDSNAFKVISHPDAIGNRATFEHCPGNKKSLFEH